MTYRFISLSPVFRFLRSPWYRRWWYAFRMRLGFGPIIELPRRYRISRVVSDHEVIMKET